MFLIIKCDWVTLVEWGHDAMSTNYMTYIISITIFHESWSIWSKFKTYSKHISNNVEWIVLLFFNSKKSNKLSIKKNFTFNLHSHHKSIADNIIFFMQIGNQYKKKEITICGEINVYVVKKWWILQFPPHTV